MASLEESSQNAAKWYLDPLSHFEPMISNHERQKIHESKQDYGVRNSRILERMQPFLLQSEIPFHPLILVLTLID